MNIAKTTIAALVFVSASAMAATPTELCGSVGQLAESIMRARQAGVSFTQMLEAADGNKIAEDLVQGAFKQPRFQSPGFIERAAQDFRERAEVDCMRILRSKGPA